MDELVDSIVRQVVAALSAQGMTVRAQSPAGPATAKSAATAPMAPVRAPAAAGPSGGQHSRAGGRPGGPRSPLALAAAVAAARGGKGPKPPAPPQKVFITADALLRRLTGEGGKVLELAPHEFLTPAALDIIEDRHVPVRRMAECLPKAPGVSDAPGACDPQSPAAAPAGAASPAAGAPASSSPCAITAAALAAGTGIGLVLEQPTAPVRTMLAALRQDRLAVVDYGQTGCWIANVRLLCEAIAAGKIARGVAILPSAAEAMVLGNKIPGIRAVQGMRSDGLATAIRRFAPNLLVLEHTSASYHEMRTLVRTFAAERPARATATVLMDTVAELEKA